MNRMATWCCTVGSVSPDGIHSQVQHSQLCSAMTASCSVRSPPDSSTQAFHAAVRPSLLASSTTSNLTALVRSGSCCRWLATLALICIQDNGKCGSCSSLPGASWPLGVGSETVAFCYECMCEHHGHVPSIRGSYASAVHVCSMRSRPSMHVRARTLRESPMYCSVPSMSYTA